MDRIIVFTVIVATLCGFAITVSAGQPIDKDPTPVLHDKSRAKPIVEMLLGDQPNLKKDTCYEDSTGYSCWCPDGTFCCIYGEGAKDCDFTCCPYGTQCTGPYGYCI